ncbi:uncharacterized protein METZ01_LOCUS67396 [marine metagenome]|jgi:hypothetical protein|uniref:Smr domain-containing protein n=1 Tax=marine metagenome TaxID=408172 RepID=A0A381TEF9_9ZZZZ
MKNSVLDLHGISHDQVDRVVENFVLLNQDRIPLEIICGNSQVMVNLVISVLDRIGCENFERVDYGTIMIRKL